MAQRFYDEAAAQVNPVYDQQIQQIQGQIPTLQNYYNNLTQGLQQQTSQQLESGVQGISEDASRRGVLRSTLPVDARQALTAQLGAALTQSLGQVGLQQTKDIGGLQSQIAGLGGERLQAIQSLAGAFQQRDLQERQFQQQQQDQQQAAQQRTVSGGGGGRATTSAGNAASKNNVMAAARSDLTSFFSRPEAQQKFYTEKTIIPQLRAAYPELSAADISNLVYQNRKLLLGY